MRINKTRGLRHKHKPPIKDGPIVVVNNRAQRRKLAAEARRKKARGPQVSNVGQGTEVFWHR